MTSYFPAQVSRGRRVKALSSSHTVYGDEVETLCGSDACGEVVSSGSKLFLHFHTNDHVTDSGFDVTYQLVDNGRCTTGVLTNLSRDKMAAIS